MSFGDRLKKARLKRNMTLLEVAEKLGRTEATIQRYESGNIKNLKSDIIEELAEIVRTSPAYLMGWISEEPDSKSEYDFYPSVYVAAGLPSPVDTVTTNNVKRISIPDAIMGRHAGSKDVFFLKVNGQSMNKLIPHGSMVAVKRIEITELQNDDIVVFSNGYDYSVKRYYNDIDHYRHVFSSESTDRGFIDHPIDYNDTDELVIHGKVIFYIVSTD